MISDVELATMLSDTVDIIMYVRTLENHGKKSKLIIPIFNFVINYIFINILY